MAAPATDLLESASSHTPVYGSPVALWNLTDEEYRAAFDGYFGRWGYRIVDVCGYEVGGQARYAAIWEPAHPPGPNTQQSYHGIPFSDYPKHFDQLKGDGYRPVRVNGYSVAGQTFFATIWEKVSRIPLWQAHHAIKLDDLYSHVSKLRGEGYDLVDLCGYPSPGLAETLCATVWEGWPGYDLSWWWIKPQVGEINYQAQFDRMPKAHWRPVRVIGFSPVSAKYRMYATIWVNADGRPWATRHGIDSRTMDNEVAQKKREGYRLVSIGGFSAGHGRDAVPAFCPIWEKREAGPVISGLVARFMQYYEVPGLSLAIAKDGRLVYAQGFGLADRTSRERVTTSTLFRIASISKTITAVAVMKLASEGKLSPIDLVFGKSGHLKDLGTPEDSRAEKIIVLHLLQHSAGGWANDEQDPMYTNPSLNQNELISWVLKNRSLDNAPGTKFAYSNFGYCVLGRVIEKATGKPYDAYVKENILAPCGITGMQIAGNTQADRRPGEAIYYGQAGENPYGTQVARMDAHGGWLATAVDLMRFAVRVDGFPTKPDILDRDLITYMTKPSGLYDSNGYASGWSTNTAGTWWHLGNLLGTEAVLVRTADGFCWAALINTRRRDPVHQNTETGLDNLMWAIRNQVDIWPPGQDL
ncbi:serine hydrolase [Nonomuraea recticatena]|uniref:Beta-lactamase-related domain-containing protein n=1 Tax=Nonomuraea recticatena TaxID=46178 RepID=A0ABN3TIE5_9ACTN